MDVSSALLLSWEKQCECLSNLASLMNEDLLKVKPSDDGWTLAEHFAHVKECRIGWLQDATGKSVDGNVPLYEKIGEVWVATTDFPLIMSQLANSQAAIATWMKQAMADGTQKAGSYDHPVMYLQHMIWHEGWHAGLIMLALRLAGAAPTEEWEELNLWANWRDAEI